VGRRPHGDDRLAGLEILIDPFHLIIGELAKACKENEQVRGFKMFKSRDVVVLVGINLARFSVDCEKNDTIKPMMFGKNLGELRESFLGSIFFVTTDEDDLFPFSWAIPPRQFDPTIVFSLERGWCQQCP
jgi:hypothetical protein